jgi:hypothetical protein
MATQQGKVVTQGSKVTLQINDAGSISFDPNDVSFAEMCYEAISGIAAKEDEYRQKGEQLEEETAFDRFGVPLNMRERLKLLRELCEFGRDTVDGLFGTGTAQMAFGDRRDPNMFDEFFEQITPFITKAREGKMARYLESSDRTSSVLK